MNELTLAKLRNLEPNFGNLQVAPILNNGKVVGFHTNALSTSGEALGSGCHEDEHTSKVIALSECIERRLFDNLKRNRSNKFQLASHPSSCGFAFGFNLKETLKRSVLEAIERWTWSRWIDQRIPITQLSQMEVSLQPFAKVLLNNFSSVRFFEHNLQFSNPLFETSDFKVGIIIAETNQGVFPGSRACHSSESPWGHASAECWRHLLISKSNTQSGLVFDRINFFSRNKAKALKQIPSFCKKQWDNPEIEFADYIPVESVSGFLTRAICSDYVGWQDGSKERFVY